MLTKPQRHELLRQCYYAHTVLYNMGINHVICLLANRNVHHESLLLPSHICSYYTILEWAMLYMPTKPQRHEFANRYILNASLLLYMLTYYTYGTLYMQTYYTYSMEIYVAALVLSMLLLFMLIQYFP